MIGKKRKTIYECFLCKFNTNRSRTLKNHLINTLNHHLIPDTKCPNCNLIDNSTIIIQHYICNYILNTRLKLLKKEKDIKNEDKNKESFEENNEV